MSVPNRAPAAISSAREAGDSNAATGRDGELGQPNGRGGFCRPGSLAGAARGPGPGSAGCAIARRRRRPAAARLVGRLRGLRNGARWRFASGGRSSGRAGAARGRAEARASATSSRQESCRQAGREDREESRRARGREEGEAVRAARRGVAARTGCGDHCGRRRLRSDERRPGRRQRRGQRPGRRAGARNREGQWHGGRQRLRLREWHRPAPGLRPLPVAGLSAPGGGAGGGGDGGRVVFAPCRRHGEGSDACAVPRGIAIWTVQRWTSRGAAGSGSRPGSVSPRLGASSPTSSSSRAAPTARPDRAGDGLAGRRFVGRRPGRLISGSRKGASRWNRSHCSRSGCSPPSTGSRWRGSSGVSSTSPSRPPSPLFWSTRRPRRVLRRG